ncbi:hypothetical protein BSKO_06291 [Bryopsis sp. KO-2023]|nr:hypothetical protein BSKO_06291 [Bryopsis sp. KO-2023]
MAILPAQPDNSWNFIFRQNIGLVLVLVSGAAMILGYDKDYISNGYLTTFCLVVALVALLLHESRPFKRWENITQEVDEMNREKESAELRRKQE